MTGFDLYRLVEKRHPNIATAPLHNKDLANLIRNSKETIRANCGELRRFSDPSVLEEILDFVMKRGGLFETTCGKHLFGGDDGRNPLIGTLYDKGCLNSDKYLAYVNYTSATPVEIVALGATHAIIFDDGEQIFIENPHGFSNHTSNNAHNGYLVSNDKELAELLEGFLWSLNYRAIISADDPEIMEATLVEEDFHRSDVRYCIFEDEEGFEACFSKYAVALSEGR